MKKIVLIIVFLLWIATPACAEELTAPEVTGDAAILLPEDRDSFGEGLWYVVRSALQQIMPDLTACCAVCLSLVAATILLSMLRSYEGKSQAAAELAGVLTIAVLLLGSTHSLIALAAETITELSEYGKLLLPVLTAALAAQGGVNTSAAIYTGTALFDAILSAAVTGILIPMVYIYLVTAIVNAAVGDELMKKLRDFVKWVMTWSLKIILYVFTGYISITGVVSGTADQAAVKAAKLTISGAVPVVGGILSDASETILVSAGLVKNSIGIYGLLALVAILILPFLKIGALYGLLKLTSALCATYSEKKLIGLMDDFAGAMGLLLGMSGTVCLILLISVVCFLKGMG